MKDVTPLRLLAHNYENQDIKGEDEKEGKDDGYFLMYRLYNAELLAHCELQRIWM
jgi:hypothetical protein